jgi:hypothetical protein
MTIAPGATAQLSATANYSDGSSKDVTTAVIWRTSDTSILTIGDSGLASARQSGDVTVTATLSSTVIGSLTGTQPILVVPSGTFRLNGRVTWLNRDLDGASVQVIAGIGAGLPAVTAADGSYRLYGVVGDIGLMVSKASYQTIQQATRIDRNTTLNFDMVTNQPLPELVGTYTLQIVADPACATTGSQTLPDSARVRRYSATIEDRGGVNGIDVRLSGATFLPQRNLIWGYGTPNGAILDVNHLDYYYGIGYPPPDLGEVLPSGDVYSPSGSIAVSAIGADLVGSLDGAIKVWAVPPGGLLGQCTSTHHTVTFTKQGSGTARTAVRR